MNALQAHQAHQARHTMPRDALLELVEQLGVDAPCAVRAAAVVMHGLDDLAQGGVGDVAFGGGSLAPLLETFKSLVIVATGWLACSRSMKP